MSIAEGGDFGPFSVGSTVPRLLVSTAPFRVVFRSGAGGSEEIAEIYR